MTALILFDPWVWWAVAIALLIVLLVLADRYEDRLLRARESLDDRQAADRCRPHGCGTRAEPRRRRGGGWSAP